MLLDRESGGPDSLAYKQLGEAEAVPDMGHEPAPDDGLKAKYHFAWIIRGMMIMLLILATLALSSAMQVAEPAARSAQATPAGASLSGAAAVISIEQSARRWLVLVGEERWDDSWNPAASVQGIEHEQKWASVSKEARPPLGAVLSRIASSQEHLPAPPHGYEMVKFRTSFANRADATEAVTLVREGSDRRVVGYWIS